MESRNALKITAEKKIFFLLYPKTGAEKKTKTNYKIPKHVRKTKTFSRESKFVAASLLSIQC